MARTKSSRRWLKEHFDDPYVKKAQKEGVRSRAVYKLMELDDKDQVLKPGRVVVDLGAAPGGWSELAAKKVLPTGKVIALDILPMDPLEGVTILTGDFREEFVAAQLTAAVGKQGADLVLSDMAPNMSGMDAVDQPRAMYLVELALDLCRSVLKPGGDLLVKIFQGEGFDEFLRQARQQFKVVKVRKPKASRDRSREVYLVARHYNG